DAEAGRSIALGIKINKKCWPLGKRKPRSQVYCGRRFPDAALLVDDRQGPGQPYASPLRSECSTTHTVHSTYVAGAPPCSTRNTFHTRLVGVNLSVNLLVGSIWSGAPVPSLIRSASDISRIFGLSRAALPGR